MLDQTKNTSKIKKGLMVLNKLKGNNNNLPDQQKSNHNNLSLNYHPPDLDLDLKRLQCQLVSTEDFMLSNADFHVKNLLTGFLEAVDEGDKSKIIESKIKKIKESQFEFEQHKVIDVFEDDKWEKSKTKIQYYQPTKSKNISSKNISIHLSSTALGGKYLLHNPLHNKLEHPHDNSSTEIYSKIKNNSNRNTENGNGNKQHEHTHANNNHSSISSHNAKNIGSRIQFTSNQIYEIPTRIKRKDKKKTSSAFKRLKNNKSSKNLRKSIERTSLENNNNDNSDNEKNNKRRLSIPQGSREDIATYVENSLQRFKTMSQSFDQSPIKSKTKEEIKDVVEDEEGFFRSRTYNRKQTEQKNKEVSNDADNMNLSYRRFKSKDDIKPTFVKASTIEEIDILNLKGLSKINKRKLSQICNKLKQNIVNDTVTKFHSNTKDSNLKTSTIEDNFLLKSSTTVVLDEKHRRLSRKGYVYDSLDDEEIDEEVEGVFYINPSSIGFIIYETLILITITYVALYKPYSLAHDFNIGRDSSLAQKIINFIVDGLLFIDVIVRFFVAYHNFDEVLITKNETIALHYLSTLFICDLTAAIPINTILYVAHASSFHQNNFPNYYNTKTKNFGQLFSIIPIVKIFKLFKWNKVSVIIQHFLLEFTHFIRWSKVYLSLILLFLSIHLLSCVFIFLGQVEYPNWIIEQKLETSSFGTIYIASVYYILSSVFTIGYGDITSISRPERLYNLFLLVVGIMVYSWALSSISTYIQTSDAKTIEFQNKCEILEEIRITHEKMPYELFDKIQRYLRYRVKNEKRDKNVIFDSLPIVLRNNLIHEMYKPIIENFIFFKNFKNPDFIVRVLLAFKPILGLKNDILVKEGDYIEEIIFVKRGNLALEIPLPIIVNPETLKRSRITFTNTLNKSFNGGTYTFNTNIGNNGKNLYALDPRDLSDKEGLRVKGTFGFDCIKKTKTKTMKAKEAIATRAYVKILEIRKNEHFGDILMFLNRRSPLSVKVKSKYVELFFLKKTDAIEISMNYPKIWREINKKSLFNMEQIDRLIDKALKLFFISNEGQKNLSHNQTSHFLETILAQSTNENLKNSEFPRTQKEIFQILNDKNDNELRSIPSDLRSIIIEESHDYEPSSIVGTSAPKEHRDMELISESNSSNEKEGQSQKDDNSSETHSTMKMNITNKSILLTERGEMDMDMDHISNKSANKKTQEVSITPFRYSDINTEIYPNEEEVNYASYETSINVNDRCFPSNSRNTTNSISSLFNQAYNNNKITKNNSNTLSPHKGNANDQDNDSNKSNDDKSEIPFAKRSCSKKHHHDDEEVNFSNQFKTIKINSPDVYRKEEPFDKSIIKLNPVNEYHESNIKKIGSINYSSCGNTSFTINSEYNNLNEINHYNTSATKALIAAIFSFNIPEIERALRKCNFLSPNKILHRSSLSLSTISLQKTNIKHNGTLTPFTPLKTPDTFIVPNDEIKTMSDRLHKRKMTKARSIIIASNPNDSIESISPTEKKKNQISKFNHSKEHGLNKSPTFNNVLGHRRSNFGQASTINLVNNLDNSPEKIPNKRVMNQLKHMKTLAAPKQNLLNVISENIVKNSQNLNNPELFYLQYFQEIMNEKNDIKEQENLVKRLEDTEKFLFDSVRKPDGNAIANTNVNPNANANSNNNNMNSNNNNP